MTKAQIAILAALVEEYLNREIAEADARRAERRTLAMAQYAAAERKPP